jgi:hypothetical protein
MNGFFSMVGRGVCGANPFRLYGADPSNAAWLQVDVSVDDALGLPIQTMCIALGQHLPYRYRRPPLGRKEGCAHGHVKQIEKLIRISRELGREIATPEQAREIHKIGVCTTPVEETLFNLGLPPNRKAGQQGFQVYPSAKPSRCERPVRMDIRLRSSAVRLGTASYM